MNETSWDEEVDLLIVGGGVAGLAAATAGAELGMTTAVVESTEYVGGTTAFSAGTCWMPGHSHFGADRAEDAAAGSNYLDALVGDKAPRTLRETYLARGPEMLDFFAQVGLQFRHSATVVDYHPELEGASVGRALEPEPFDGRRLGQEFRRVRWPMREFALFGGTLMLRRAEVNELLRVYQGAPKAMLLALRLGIRWAADMLRHPRGTRLTMGNALIATLLNSYLERGGRIEYSSSVKNVILDDDRVVGAIVQTGGRERRIRVHGGVVLAGGGFASDQNWRTRNLPTPAPQYSPAAPGARGTSIEVGLAAGATLGPDHGDNAFWFPSSIGRRRDGSQAVFPHIWDRAKPGIIAVGASGRRFIDESVSYHRFTRAMYAAQAVPAWLILDSHALRAYGIGMARPHSSAGAIRRLVRDGYLTRATTIEELARQIEVNPEGLAETVRVANESARTGVDPEYDKGTSPFGHQYGDPTHRPNPNLGPVTRAPFYAVSVVPTPLSTALGLRTDEHARALGEDGVPIAGLYACGNDADSPMAAEYPGAGCQVGAGLTFGYLAATHALSRVESSLNAEG